jgi:hypothetical protein
VTCLGEFGRAPRVALEPKFAGSTPGRKHWASVYSAVVAGAGVARGTAYGSSDRFAAQPVSDRVGPWDVAATMFWALGIDRRASTTIWKAGLASSPLVGQLRDCLGSSVAIPGRAWKQTTKAQRGVIPRRAKRPPVAARAESRPVGADGGSCEFANPGLRYAASRAIEYDPFGVGKTVGGGDLGRESGIPRVTGLPPQTALTPALSQGEMESHPTLNKRCERQPKMVYY